jgi:hypothetical protein
VTEVKDEAWATRPENVPLSTVFRPL